MKCIVIVISFLLFSASGEGWGLTMGDKSANELLYSDDMDEMKAGAHQLASQGKEGIPILLEALSKSLEKPFHLISMERSGLCIRALNSLAKDRIYLESEVPVLIHAIKKQAVMEATYLTADTLRLITGIDPGYSKEYAEKYTEKDEPERKRKIARWEEWWNHRHP